MAGKDCGCGGVKVADFSQQGQGNPATPTGGSSLIESLVTAAALLGGDTSKMANSEIVDALCHALVIAREEKQALASALDVCNDEVQEYEKIIEEYESGGNDDDDEDEDTEVD